MTLEKMRELNLFYKCHERYHPGHQCKNRALNAMESEEFVDANEEVVEPELGEVEDQVQA